MDEYEELEAVIAAAEAATDRAEHGDASMNMSMADSARGDASMSMCKETGIAAAKAASSSSEDENEHEDAERVGRRVGSKSKRSRQLNQGARRKRRQHEQAGPSTT